MTKVAVILNTTPEDNEQQEVIDILRRLWAGANVDAFTYSSLLTRIRTAVPWPPTSIEDAQATRPEEDALRASVAELQAQLVDVSAALQRANEATSRAERERDVLKIERDALYRQLGLSVRGDTHD